MYILYICVCVTLYKRRKRHDVDLSWFKLPNRRS